MVLAVGQHHQDLVAVALLVGGQSGLDRLGQRCAALGNDVHVERLDALAEGGVVNGQRALEEGAARKGHQSESVGFGSLHQIERGQLGARQAIRRNILRQHALRGVNGDHDVQAALLDLLPVEAPLRARQCQDQAGHGRDQAAHADLLPRGRNADRQRRQQSRLDELG